MIEAFFAAHQHTIEAASSLGTWAAVVVALILARGASRPKLRVVADLSRIITTEQQLQAEAEGRFEIRLEDCQQVIGVTIRNNGQRPVHIGYFGFSWGFPPFWRWFCRRLENMQQNPVTQFRGEGLLLEPGRAESIVLTNQPDDMPGEFEGLCRRNGLPVWLKRFIRLHVRTSDGYLVKAKMDPRLREKLLGQEQGEPTRGRE